VTRLPRKRFTDRPSWWRPEHRRFRYVENPLSPRRPGRHAAAPALAVPALALGGPDPSFEEFKRQYDAISPKAKDFLREMALRDDTSADAELLALRPELELIIRDYVALQAVDDWAEVDPDLERWSMLHDRMHPLVDRIMSHRPKTLAGLGMMTRAASLSYDDYERENDGGENRHGNLISAVCPFCSVEPIITDHEDEAADGEVVS
jgi:hypothetical protein